jgi:hypothetical protein
MGLGPRCLYIEDHLLTPPLTRQFVGYLDLTPHAQAVLEKLKAEVSRHNLEESKRRRREAEIKAHIANLEKYLGAGDPDREETYWRLIREAKAELKILNDRPPVPRFTTTDLHKVTEFLENLEDNWGRYPRTLRNRLLTLLVDRVELRHDLSHIEAVIIWKTGFSQTVVIKRTLAHFANEKRWQADEDNLLRLLWPSASRETVVAALPERTPEAISQRASRLELRQQWEKKLTDTAPLWTEEDDNQLRELYTTGVSVGEIASKLGRSQQAIRGRASSIGASRPKGFYPRKVEPIWEAENIKVMQEATSPSRQMIVLARSG